MYRAEVEIKFLHPPKFVYMADHSRGKSKSKFFVDTFDVETSLVDPDLVDFAFRKTYYHVTLLTTLQTTSVNVSRLFFISRVFVHH